MWASMLCILPCLVLTQSALNLLHCKVKTPTLAASCRSLRFHRCQLWRYSRDGVSWFRWTLLWEDLQTFRWVHFEKRGSYPGCLQKSKSVFSFIFIWKSKTLLFETTDFLPMRCDACQEIFCKDHITYANHKCMSSYKKVNQNDFTIACFNYAHTIQFYWNYIKLQIQTRNMKTFYNTHQNKSHSKLWPIFFYFCTELYFSSRNKQNPRAMMALMFLVLFSKSEWVSESQQCGIIFTCYKSLILRLLNIWFYRISRFQYVLCATSPFPSREERCLTSKSENTLIGTANQTLRKEREKYEIHVNHINVARLNYNQYKSHFNFFYFFFSFRFSQINVLKEAASRRKWCEWPVTNAI